MAFRFLLSTTALDAATPSFSLGVHAHQTKMVLCLFNLGHIFIIFFSDKDGTACTIVTMLEAT